MTISVRNSMLFCLFLLLLPGAAVAQTGVNTNLWTWTEPAIHHDSVVEVITELGSGTGVLVHVFETRPLENGFEGLCLTAEHVVREARNIKVAYRNGKRAKNCKAIESNRELDASLLRVWVPLGISPVTLADAGAIIGDQLEFCGLGGDSSLSRLRHFSSVAESPTNSNQIFASAALLPGDSGGPVFNVDGKVVGIISGGWFWFDGGVKTEEGKNVSVTWPARACHLDVLSGFVERAIAASTDLAKN